jgi:hypothetical protein
MTFMSNITQIKSRISQLTNINISEADTSRMIIEPILQWLGYDVYDWNTVREQVTIHESSQKGNDGRADYGILIRGVFCFMIEAKKLGSSSLEDVSEIKKALDYCNHNDRPRFAILTDGRFWRVFDNEVGGAPSSRELIQIDVLEKHEWLNILKPSFLKTLHKHSDLVAAVKISNVKTQKVLLDMLLKNMMEELEAEPTLPQQEGFTHPLLCVETQQEFDIWTDEPTHKTPNRILIKETQQVLYVNKWTLVLFEIFKHLSKSRATDMAQMKRPRGGLMFPKESLKYKTPQDVSANSKVPLVFEMNGSSNELITKLKFVLEQLKVPKDAFIIFCE